MRSAWACLLYTSANVDLAEMMGSEIYLYLTCAGRYLVARVPSRTGIKAEDHVKLALDTNKIHVFDAETEELSLIHI